MIAYNMFASVAILISVFICVTGEECIYDDRGLCLIKCPPDTYSYNPSCVEEAFSLRTCRQPQARAIGVFCDFSRCDCSKPKVWDEAAKKCVMLADCSDQSKVTDDDRV
ncbi:uncharacterized protein ACR2FA_011620 [Aphomia sociella]